MKMLLLPRVLILCFKCQFSLSTINVPFSPVYSLTLYTALKLIFAWPPFQTMNSMRAETLLCYFISILKMPALFLAKSGPQ